MMVEREMVHDEKRQKLIGSRSPTLNEATHQLDDATHKKYLSEQTKAAAEYSLECYQRMTGISYTLVHPSNSNGFYRMSNYVVHVNFTAKKDDGSEIEYFFSEVTYNQLFDEWSVRATVTFNPADKTNISKSCSACSKGYTIPILHPAGSYVLGQYDEEDYINCDYEYSSGDDPQPLNDFSDDSEPEFFF